VESVYAEVDGVRYQARLGIARPDIAQTWGSEFVDYGWELRFPIARTTQSFVSVFAQLSTGERGLIYLGVLEPRHLLELAPWGYLDSTATEGSSFILGGWAAASSGKKIVGVATTISGEKYNASLGERREDVCHVLADQGYLNSGWHIHIPVEKVRKPVEIQVVAEASDGESKVLYKGQVQAN